MLRFVIFGVVVATFAVVLRLLFIRTSFPKPQFDEQPGPNVIEMPATKPLTIKHFFFANFDHSSGPADRDNFFENLVVHVGPEDSPRYRVYSLWVATASALKNGGDPYRFGRGLLIVERYDMEVILRAVREHIRELGLLALEVE
jgi:hypothetical protein